MPLKNLPNDQFLALLKDISACWSARHWVGERDMKTALMECPRLEWLDFVVDVYTFAEIDDPRLNGLPSYYSYHKVVMQGRAALFLAENRAEKARAKILETATEKRDQKRAEVLYDYEAEVHAIIVDPAHSKKLADVFAARDKALTLIEFEFDGEYRRAQKAFTDIYQPVYTEMLNNVKALFVFED